MPSRYVIRSFAESSYYHVFNRGVEKRTIFEDPEDFKIFKYYIFVYLAPLEKVLAIYPNLPLRLRPKNLSNELDLITYCLMPNHFHLLLKQTTKDAISKFMQRITDGYTRYFNNKNKRVGSLVEGPFKAAHIDSDNLLLHISRYIHLNPLVSGLIKDDLQSYPWSSFPAYLNQNQDNLIKKDEILNHFASTKDFEKFVLDQAEYAKELEKIKHAMIEAE